MKSTIIKISIAFFAFSLVFTSCFKDDLLREIDDLRTLVVTLQQKNDSLNKVINLRADSLAKALTASQKRSDSLAVVLRTKTDSLSQALGFTNTNLLNMGKSIDSIKTQLTGINTQLTQLSSQLAATNSQIATLTLQLASANADIVALNTKYQQLTTQLQNINAQIAALQAEQAKLLDKLNAILLILNPPADITTGLVAYYPFTGNAGDSSGNGNHGTLNGATPTSGKNGIPNTAYFFNGVSNNINIPNPLFNGTQVGEFTFSTRIKVLSTANSPNIWGKTFFWGETNFQINTDNSIRFWWANSYSGNKYSALFTNSNTVLVGEWTDIVVVFKNSFAKIYVNGILVPINYDWSAQGGARLSSTQVESVCNFAQDPNTSKFGSRVVSGASTAFFNGIIDEFRVYNRSLTQSEITYLATH